MCRHPETPTGQTQGTKVAAVSEDSNTGACVCLEFPILLASQQLLSLTLEVNNTHALSLTPTLYTHPSFKHIVENVCGMTELMGKYSLNVSHVHYSQALRAEVSETAVLSGDHTLMGEQTLVLNDTKPDAKQLKENKNILVYRCL